ncbi:Peptidase M15A [Desulfatibacillum aliphaticivorans]|uniref:Peptidase M15A n=1 Tax=Desulfatibacillum aliphaticivorans TaxID=218208 RepID=B8FBW1_DESAL|nr:D-Ala-D-Ala carboxypeptidase family metallohydrolase [Desulfatibacillum aliphaticivorans]ACL05166.1 Peptidase M15A [Desulfatibacillum aliphaticivorans]
MKKTAYAALMCLCALLWSAGESLAEFDAQRAGFSILSQGEILPYKVMGAFAMPGQNLEIRETKAKTINCKSLSGEGCFERKSDDHWTFKCPSAPGLYPLLITRKDAGAEMTLNLFVMTPFSSLKEGRLNGYRIGQYPAVDKRKLPIYKLPQGFVEVTEENRGALVSPHFRLQQFLCKQQGSYPKYLVLRPLLLLKLEALLEEVNKQGIAANSFHIMSGYRTPYYNEAIGNVKYSRHVWGGAADIFIDENPVDNMMDDLNGDGKINYRDSRVLYDIVDKLYGKKWYERFVGGLGNYKKTSQHGPFVHVDVRGFRARWGD